MLATVWRWPELGGWLGRPMGRRSLQRWLGRARSAAALLAVACAACAPAAPPAPTPVPPTAAPAATPGAPAAASPSVAVASPVAPSPSPVVKPAASPSASAAASPSPAAKPGAAAAAPDASAPSGSAQHGQEVFTSIGCYACHGTVGQGASTGPRLAPNPIPFAAFQQQVRQPRQDMPRYGPQFLSDQDLADIYAYMQSIQPGPAATSIPLLNP